MPSVAISSPVRLLFLPVVAVFCLAIPAAESTANDARLTPIVRAVQSARDSVVNIHGEKTVSTQRDDADSTERQRRVNGMGTGIVIDERGYIVTNYHVVQGVKRIQVTLADSSTHIGRLISFDRETDLAIIKVSAGQSLPVIAMGSSDDLMTGETVIAVGNAYGYNHTVTRGIVSALHREVQVSEEQHYADLIQTDASINPGNSGGPLLNIRGEMIGVNVAVRAGAQGIGFAIPVDRAMEVTARLMNDAHGDKYWHGIVLSPRQKKGSALVVSRVEAGSPAEDAGIEPGDILDTVAGLQISRPLDLERALLGRGGRRTVSLQVVRDEEPLELSLRLASSRPKRDGLADRVWRQLGVRLREAPTERIRRVSRRYRGGLEVVAVREGSPAADEKIRRGDILVGMHVWETISLDNVAYVLQRKDVVSEGPVRFFLVRGTKEHFGHVALSQAASRR